MGQKVFKTPTEVFEDQLNDIFVKEDEENNNLIIKSLSILLKMPDSNNDLSDLYNLLGLDEFVGVLSLFEGRTIHFPDKEEVKDLILTSLLYYYREIENLTWKEIKEKIPFEFSSISYSTKIKKMNTFLIGKLHEILSEENNE